MSDWQVGDKALCIQSGRVTREGRVYTVRAVALPGDRAEGYVNQGPDTNLRFVGCPTRPGYWSGADRFRKIHPDKNESCEPEFVELLKRSKVGANA